MTDKPFDEIDFGLMLLTAIVPPHWPWAALLAVQFVVRRNPTASAYVLDAVGWEPEEAPPWLLPGAQRILAMPERPKVHRMPKLAPRQERAVPAPQRHATPVVRERPRWLEVVNDQPDQRPHVMITGPSRSGKTTLATAAMGDREGRAVVITPKINPHNWSGAEIITLDDDGTYAPILSVLDDLEAEKRMRIRTLRTHGADALEPMTIVFDEIGDLATHAPRAPELMTELSSIGAELKMRLIGIATSDDALGVKRWKATRNNYVRVEMNADRRAAINDGVRTMTVQPRESVAMAQAARLTPWRGIPEPEPIPPPLATRRPIAADVPKANAVSVRLPVPAPATNPDDLLASLLGETMPAPKPSLDERIAAVLQAAEAQTVTVARDGGGDVHVHVQQVSTAPAPVGRTRAAKAGGITAKDRRRRLEYINAARRGEKFEPTYQRLKGSRNEMHALFTEHRPK